MTTTTEEVETRLKQAREEYSFLHEQFQYADHDVMDGVILKMAAKEKELDALRLQLRGVPEDADFSAFQRSYPIGSLFG